MISLVTFMAILNTGIATVQVAAPPPDGVSVRINSRKVIRRVRAITKQLMRTELTTDVDCRFHKGDDHTYGDALDFFNEVRDALKKEYGLDLREKVFHSECVNMFQMLLYSYYTAINENCMTKYEKPFRVDIYHGDLHYIHPFHEKHGTKKKKNTLYTQCCSAR